MSSSNIENKLKIFLSLLNGFNEQLKEIMKIEDDEEKEKRYNETIIEYERIKQKISEIGASND